MKETFSEGRLVWLILIPQNDYKNHEQINNTPTNQSWSIDFHITVVQILAIILAIIFEKNFKMEDNLSCPVVFTLLQRLAVFASQMDLQLYFFNRTKIEYRGWTKYVHEINRPISPGSSSFCDDKILSVSVSTLMTKNDYNKSTSNLGGLTNTCTRHLVEGLTWLGLSLHEGLLPLWFVHVSSSSEKHWISVFGDMSRRDGFQMDGLYNFCTQRFHRQEWYIFF